MLINKVMHKFVTMIPVGITQIINDFKIWYLDFQMPFSIKALWSPEG